jgi:hypothetical protein
LLRQIRVHEHVIAKRITIVRRLKAELEKTLMEYGLAAENLDGCRDTRASNAAT